MRTQKIAALLVGLGAMTAGALGQLAPQMKARPSQHYLQTPTYDRSGQTVEPCVIYVPEGWNGYKYWMAVAPYPYLNAKKENPSILASNDTPGATQRWVVPPGVTNPLVPEPPGKNTHNADQSIFLDRDGTMYLYYNWTDYKTKDVLVISSTDGWKTHTAPQVIQHTGLAESNPEVCTVLYDSDSGKYYMWYVDASKHPDPFMRLSSESPLGPFSNAQRCRVNGIPAGRELDEQNIIRVPGSKALFALMTIDQQNSKASNTTLHFMDSMDGGLTWNMNPVPVINPGARGSWKDHWIYRASLQPTPATWARKSNRYDIWYSACNTALAWHTGYAVASLVAAPGVTSARKVKPKSRPWWMRGGG